VAIKHLFPVGEGLSSEQTKKYVDREIMLLKCANASARMGSQAITPLQTLL
jgi:hypothetical protein